MTITIYPARRVITMQRSNPFAAAVAVKDGRVLGVGTVDELMSWDDTAVIDETFADKVIVPGFIEAHCHAMTGIMWTRPYVGFFDRHDPDGELWEGCQTLDAVVERLQAVDATMTADGLGPDTPLLAWGLDPIYFEGERMLAVHLDRVSLERPIFILHVSGHLATVNTAMLTTSSITAETETPGVSKGDDGEPDGELQEPAAMSLASGGLMEMLGSVDPQQFLPAFAADARNTGTTLVTDLGNSQLIQPDLRSTWSDTINQADFPVRMMVALSSMMSAGPNPITDQEMTTAFNELSESATDKLRFGVIKMFLDGSIQGFTARISWPHYFAPPPGHPGNGIWLMAPEEFTEKLQTFHDAGLIVHVHCNGDEATELFLDALEQVLITSPRPDHRHTVQHCQLSTPAQYRRMAKLGMCANIFANHIFYWGDQHRSITVGPERARGMDACATALAEGVPFSIHSDSPVTPLGHLHTMWCAVNRVTASGFVLGEEQRISAMDALHAVTLGAAYQLKLDHEMGSVEAGKLADFAVLDDDPLEVDPMTIKDIGVWGTVLGGRPLPKPS